MIRMLRSTVLMIATTCLMAADGAPELFTVAYGSPLVAGERIPIGGTIPLGARIECPEGLVRLALLGCEDGHIILAPGTSADTQELQAGDEFHLRFRLFSGSAQCDIQDLPASGFDRMVVRGAASDVTMTGTLFVVHRVRRDADYVALIEGSVTVRATLAALDDQGDTSDEESVIELGGRQSVTIDAVAGLSDIEILTARPQLPVSAGAEVGLGSSADWGADQAAEASGLLDEGPALADEPVAMDDAPPVADDALLGNEMSVELGDAFVDEGGFANDLDDTTQAGGVVDVATDSPNLGGDTEPLTSTLDPVVIDVVLVTTSEPGVLAGPPPPPTP